MPKSRLVRLPLLIEQRLVTDRHRQADRHGHRAIAIVPELA